MDEGYSPVLGYHKNPEDAIGNIFDVFFSQYGCASCHDFDKASVPASKGGASYSKRPRQELAAR